MTVGRKRPVKFHYEADQDVNESLWLAMTEEKRLGAVRAAHRNPPPSHPPLMSPEGHVAMHVIIENQLASGEPTQVRAALGRLRAAGLGRHEAIHAIASVLVRHLHGLLRGTPAEH